MQTPFRHHVPSDLVENLRWRAKAHRRAIEDIAFKGVLREASAADPIFFMNAYGWTYDPRGKTPDQKRAFPKLPFILYPYQEDALLELIDHIGNRDLLIDKSRDMGASCLCIAAVAWCWLFRPLQSFLLVSRV